MTSAGFSFKKIFRAWRLALRGGTDKDSGLLLASRLGLGIHPFRQESQGISRHARRGMPFPE